ncbi:uncharacterized protein ACOB8E_010357 isoform 1-T1 [Sarcophilus harrisii]
MAGPSPRTGQKRRKLRTQKEEVTLSMITGTLKGTLFSLEKEMRAWGAGNQAHCFPLLQSHSMNTPASSLTEYEEASGEEESPFESPIPEVEEAWSMENTETILLGDLKANYFQPSNLQSKNILIQWKEHYAWSQETWMPILALRITAVKSVNLFETQLPLL